jgi:hypothetical protein
MLIRFDLIKGRTDKMFGAALSGLAGLPISGDL